MKLNANSFSWNWPSFSFLEYLEYLEQPALPLGCVPPGQTEGMFFCSSPDPLDFSGRAAQILEYILY